MGDIKKFLKTLATDPKARELLKGSSASTIEEIAKVYAGAAKELGFQVEKAELVKFLEAEEKYSKEKAAKAEQTVKEALNEDELETVAGGGCADTFAPGEWCFFTDSCSVVINYYTDKDAANYNVEGTCENNSFGDITTELMFTTEDEDDYWSKGDYTLWCKGSENL